MLRHITESQAYAQQSCDCPKQNIGIPRFSSSAFSYNCVKTNQIIVRKLIKSQLSSSSLYDDHKEHMILAAK